MPFTLERSAELPVIIHTMKKSIHKVSDGQISIRFPCFLAERTWEKAWYLTTFFHGRCLHGCFNCSFTCSLKQEHLSYLLYPPQTLFVGGILFSRCPSVRPSFRPSVTLCFLNNSKSHCWIFIKPCKHVHICKTNTWDRKVRARGQFY